MRRPYSIALRVLWGLLVGMLSAAATEDPAPQPLPQITLTPENYGVPAVPPPPGDTRPPDSFLYPVTLSHITWRLMQSEMDQTFVPNIGSVVLRPSESTHYPFRIAGLTAIIPGPSNRVPLVLATPDGFASVRDIIHIFDIPKSRSPQKPQTRKGMDKGAKLDQPPLSASEIEGALMQVRGVMNDTPDGGTSDVPEGIHCYRIPLTHATPLEVLGKLRRAYVPDSGAVMLKPGEVLRSSFPLKGVEIIFPNLQDNSLYVYATPDGYAFVKDLLMMLDVRDAPETRATLPPVSVPSHIEVAP